MATTSATAPERDGDPPGSRFAADGRRSPAANKEITVTDALTVEELAVRTGISGDEAQELIDRLGTDRAAIEQAARGIKGRRKS